MAKLAVNVDIGLVLGDGKELDLGSQSFDHFEHKQASHLLEPLVSRDAPCGIEFTYMSVSAGHPAYTFSTV